MQQKKKRKSMVLRCGEHSSAYMYAEPLLPLERRAAVVVWEMFLSRSPGSARSRWISQRFLMKTHMKKARLAEARIHNSC